MAPAELIALAKDMPAANARGEALHLSDDELAFYDTLEVNDSGPQRAHNACRLPPVPRPRLLFRQAAALVFQAAAARARRVLVHHRLSPQGGAEDLSQHTKENFRKPVDPLGHGPTSYTGTAGCHSTAWLGSARMATTYWRRHPAAACEIEQEIVGVDAHRAIS